MYKYYWVPSDTCTVLQSSSWFVREFMYKYYWVPSDPCAVLQSSSWFVCLSSCTNTTECHLTLVQYCSLAPGLCVWVHVHILLSAIWSFQMALSSICTWTQTHKPGARLQYCTRVRWHSVVFVHEPRHKPGARLQYCTRVRWHSVVFVHELRHTNQELDCSTAQGSDGTQ
jgi:hypothetical protein